MTTEDKILTETPTSEFSEDNASMSLVPVYTESMTESFSIQYPEFCLTEDAQSDNTITFTEIKNITPQTKSAKVALKEYRPKVAYVEKKNGQVRDISYLINYNNHKTDCIKNAVFCRCKQLTAPPKCTYEYRFYDLHYNDLNIIIRNTKQLSENEIVNKLDKNVYIKNSAKVYTKEINRHYNDYYYRQQYFHYKFTDQYGSILLDLNFHVDIYCYFSILENCIDTTQNNLLHPSRIQIHNKLDCRVNYYGVNNTLLFSKTFPFELSLHKDFTTIFDDACLDYKWCIDNSDNITKKSESKCIIS